ncbi:MAG: isopentenyl-diphosphate Delta-isomerase [Gammaproteobacteria bacterium]
MDTIILVNENDEVIGSSNKQTTHEQGLCHRAFSVFILRQGESELEVLLQQRHHGKYHCGGLWTNTCCSHPRPGESTLAAGQRRLNEELGFSCVLHEIGVFHYIAHFDNGLTENEIDHVLVGHYNNEPIQCNEKEISNIEWKTFKAINEDYEASPEKYTPWFMKAFQLLQRHSLG